MFYYGLKISLFLLFLLIARYLIKRFKKTIFYWVNKKEDSHKNTYHFLSLISILFMIIDTINAITVVSFLLIFLKIYDLIIYIIQKIGRKELNNDLSYILTIFSVTVILSYGYFLAHYVVETDYTIQSRKDIGTDNFRIIKLVIVI